MISDGSCDTEDQSNENYILKYFEIENNIQLKFLIFYTIKIKKYIYFLSIMLLRWALDTVFKKQNKTKQKTLKNY